MGSFLPPLTWKQNLYILFYHTIIPTFIISGINFGVDAAMYLGQHNLKIWFFPSTYAGDLGVTVLVEVWVTWLLIGSLVWTDVKKKRIEPIRNWASWPRKGPISPLLPILFKLFPKRLHFLLSDSHMDILGPLFSFHWRKFFRRLVYDSLSGLLLSVYFFCIWWPIGVGIAQAIWGFGIIPNWPWNQIFKVIFAVTLGFFISPLTAMAALAQAGLFEQDAMAATNPSIQPAPPANGAPVGLANGRRDMDLEKGDEYLTGDSTLAPAGHVVT